MAAPGQTAPAPHRCRDDPHSSKHAGRWNHLQDIPVHDGRYRSFIKGLTFQLIFVFLSATPRAESILAPAVAIGCRRGSQQAGQATPPLRCGLGQPRPRRRNFRQDELKRETSAPESNHSNVRSGRFERSYASRSTGRSLVVRKRHSSALSARQADHNRLATQLVSRSHFITAQVS